MNDQGNLKIIVLLKTIQVIGLVDNTQNKCWKAVHVTLLRPFPS